MRPLPPASNTQALVLANGAFCTPNAKTTHGLVRVSERFEIVGVIDPAEAGADAGEKLDGRATDIAIFSSVDEALRKLESRPSFLVIGVATHGGVIPPEVKKELTDGIGAGLHAVNGLHEYMSDDPNLRELASKNNVELIDIRRPPAPSELHFWTGEILSLKTPRVAVLGTDCALGKRTTAQRIRQLCQHSAIKAEMLFTGQTGWLQGLEYGMIFDSIPNDFVSGELEYQILRCAAETNPDLILLEGQSSLRNPSGPCGSEFLLSAQAKHVVLQHAPSREFFEGYEDLELAIPSLESEVRLIEAYGSKVMAITINTNDLGADQHKSFREEFEDKLAVPVIDALDDKDIERLAPHLKNLVEIQL